MSFGLVYWILMLIWFVFGFWAGGATPGGYKQWGGNVLLFILLIIIGWKVFGPPIHS